MDGRGDAHRAPADIQMGETVNVRVEGFCDKAIMHWQTTYQFVVTRRQARQRFAFLRTDDFARMRERTKKRTSREAFHANIHNRDMSLANGAAHCVVGRDGERTTYTMYDQHGESFAIKKITYGLFRNSLNTPGARDVAAGDALEGDARRPRAQRSGPSA